MTGSSKEGLQDIRGRFFCAEKITFYAKPCHKVAGDKPGI